MYISVSKRDFRVIDFILNLLRAMQGTDIYIQFKIINTLKVNIYLHISEMDDSTTILHICNTCTNITISLFISHYFIAVYLFTHNFELIVGNVMSTSYPCLLCYNGTHPCFFVVRSQYWYYKINHLKTILCHCLCVLFTLITPASVPQKTMSLPVRRLVILLPADNLPTFCCVLLNQILFSNNGMDII